ncbi:branched-chain amino acid ABC transporter permease [Rhodococcus sp. B10]|uniref:branched-chain amino acid ABC transporter permease n=1 Tax=Rhodococcus sp. B10 TaxID=2695876 RepID=UPI001430DAB9|nr:branched-chain amino acid ABC transporter permease [Rhodococcus sp. B10]NIL78346.1 High-affinity branched-chain amino acid transport system permease protein LivH [Rhodococcus sp. B10]
MTTFVQSGIDALSLGALYALFSLSVAVIFGVARIVNFANGELMTVTGYTMVLVVGLYWPIVLVVAVIVTVLAALAMDSLVFRWVRAAPPTTLLIVSFAVSYFMQNGILMIEGSRPKTLDFGSALINSISIGGVRVSVFNLVTIGATIVIVAALTVLFNKTGVGRQLRAASEDFAMARLLGVKANRVIAYAFAISGALAAVAGVLLTVSTATVTPDFGVQPVIIAFIAVVVGGIGSLSGAAVGGLLLGIVTVLLQTALPDPLKVYRDAFVFVLVISMLLARPQGLLPPAFAKERV